MSPAREYILRERAASRGVIRYNLREHGVSYSDLSLHPRRGLIGWSISGLLLTLLLCLCGWLENLLRVIIVKDIVRIACPASPFPLALWFTTMGWTLDSSCVGLPPPGLTP